MALTLLPLLSRALTCSSWNWTGNRCRVPWWPLYYHQLPARKLLRLTLVFWLGAVAGKVAFLIAVEICDLTNVMPLLLFFQDIGSIDTGGQSLLFLLLSMFLPLTPEFLLFILSVVFFRWLYRIVIWWGWLRIFGFGFFGTGQVFRALGLHFWGSIVRRVVAPEVTDIWVPNHGAGS